MWGSLYIQISTISKTKNVCPIHRYCLFLVGKSYLVNGSKYYAIGDTVRYGLNFCNIVVVKKIIRCFANSSQHVAGESEREAEKLTSQSLTLITCDSELATKCSKHSLASCLWRLKQSWVGSEA